MQGKIVLFTFDSHQDFHLDSTTVEYQKLKALFFLLKGKTNLLLITLLENRIN